MNVGLIVVGSILAAVGLWAALFAGFVTAALARWRIGWGLRGLAFVVRIAMGSTLLWAAAASAYPTAVRVIGALLIASGIAAVTIPDAWMNALIAWVVRRGPTVLRIGGVSAAALGGFVIYAGV